MVQTDPGQSVGGKRAGIFSLELLEWQGIMELLGDYVQLAQHNGCAADNP